MQVISVNSAGGYFEGDKVLRGRGAQSYIYIGSTTSLPVRFGENVSVAFVFAPLNRLIYSSLGFVVFITTSNYVCGDICYQIQMSNTSLPYIVPSSWNPAAGDAVLVTVGSA